MKKTLKAQYEEIIHGLDQYGSNVSAIISELLLDSGIQTHSVTHRVKDFKSASRKYSLRPGRYKDLSDLTDVLGVRIITFFPYDVDKAAKVLEKELSVDRDNTVDKRKLLDPDKFGYLSFHYVVQLSNSRSKLVEYKRFSELRFEIQIRSILQHAWAEIEHDLGYKAEGTAPSEIKRSFSRLAGLLELADEEFERIREKLNVYDTHVNEVIDSAPQTLMLDQSTVAAALRKEDILLNLDQAIARADNSKLNENFSIDYVSSETRQLKTLGVKDIESLLKIAQAYMPYVEKFAEYWLKNDDSEHDPNASFSRGIGLFYLSYVIAAQLSTDQIVDWNPELRKAYPDILDEVHDTWSRVTQDLGKPSKKIRSLLEDV